MSDKHLIIHPLEHLGGGEIRTAFCMGDPCRPGFELVALPSWLTHEQRTEIGDEIAAAHQMRLALEKAVADYGKPGGPWNVPSEPGTWIDMAKGALAVAHRRSSASKDAAE